MSPAVAWPGRLSHQALRDAGDMTSISRASGSRLYLSGLVACVAALAGCRPPVESTSQSGPLSLLDRDPREDGVDADCWPGWRGPNGSGIAPGGSPAIHFGAGEGFRWKVEVPGEGNSSPVVWGDCVLLTTARVETDPRTLSLLCFRRSDGHRLWQAEVGPARGPTHKKNGHASATVATDGERIFAFFGATGLYCHDFSGKQVWRAELGELSHMWGTAASPIVYGDLVIQLCDSQKDSYIAAFDKRSGKEVWRTPRDSSGCWTTPIVAEAEVDAGRRMELIVNGTSSRNPDGRLVLAYDPSTGDELWRVRGTTELVTPTALASGGLVYSTSGRNGPILAIRPGGSGDVTETNVVWRVRRGGPYIPSGVVYRNRLFIVRDARSLDCYNAGNGERIWTARLRGTFSASLIAADGRIYATNERGTVYVFAAADTFELLAQNEMEEPCLATPAIAGGELFLRTRNHLYCIPESSSSIAGEE